MPAAKSTTVAAIMKSDKRRQRRLARKAAAASASAPKPAHSNAKPKSARAERRAARRAAAAPAPAARGSRRAKNPGSGRGGKGIPRAPHSQATREKISKAMKAVWARRGGRKKAANKPAGRRAGSTTTPAKTGRNLRRARRAS